MNDFEDGRYVGDLRAELRHNPAAKRPYEVLVWCWGCVGPTYNENRPAWRNAYYYTDGVHHRKEFRHLDKAVTRHHRVMAVADLGWLRICQHKVAEARWERIL